MDIQLDNTKPRNFVIYQHFLNSKLML